MAILLSKFADYFDQASAFGYAPEVCSAHRLLAGTFIRKDFPQPHFIIWSNQVCDNTAKSGDALMELYEIPGFYLDRPYNSSEKEVQYYIKQLEYLIGFIEEQTNKKMDYDRLSEIVALAERVNKLSREIYEMRKTSPAPMRNRTSVNLSIIDWLWSGTPEAVHYFETVRDEVKAQIDNRGKNWENYRLLSIFAPPFYEMKMLDWMEREYGAKIAIEVGNSWWVEGDMVPSKPVESIARQSFYRPGARQMHGPGPSFVTDAVKLAIDFQVSAAVYYAHIGCRQACALIRSVKDKLKDELGIPTLVLDCDIMDPSLTPEGDLRGKLEGFFEMLEDRK
jgi:benzoyl-CoA reductase/2-hydroxyglutaryl-CoA dehydratase subunit BcrC/BadD/HgdB